MTDARPRTIAVIGAGLGGLSAAGYLAAAGMKVDVFERQSFPGGKAGELSAGGFRFDTGPSLVTMRDVFIQFFQALDFDPGNSLRFEALDPLCSYFFADGSRLKSSSHRETFAGRLQDVFGEDPAQLRAFLDHAADIYRISAPVFLFSSIHEISKWEILKRMSPGNIRALRPFSTMTADIQRYFSDPRCIQLFQRYATYNGSDPFQVPATLNIIPHVEYDGGSYAALPSIHAIPAVMEDACREHGVRFFYNRPVEEIITARARMQGIRVNGRVRSYDIVVTDTDVLYTYEHLLENKDSKYYRRYRRLEPSSSGIVFYWAVKRKFPQLTLHNIFFSSDYEGEFRQIFREHRLAEDPTVYVNISAKVNKDDAAPGGENWFVLINTPPDDGGDWSARAASVRKRVIHRVARGLGLGAAELSDTIDEKGMLSPADIAEQTSSFRGSLYGIASNKPAAAFLRHPNRSSEIEGLYFCGGSAHPGGGMPLSVLSGKICAELIQKRGRNS